MDCYPGDSSVRQTEAAKCRLRKLCHKVSRKNFIIFRSWRKSWSFSCQTLSTNEPASCFNQSILIRNKTCTGSVIHCKKKLAELNGLKSFFFHFMNIFFRKNKNLQDFSANNVLLRRAKELIDCLTTKDFYREILIRAPISIAQLSMKMVTSYNKVKATSQRTTTKTRHFQLQNFLEKKNWGKL